MLDFDDTTTTELLTLTKSIEVVANFAGMRDLSAFDQRPEKLRAICEAIMEMEAVPPSLSDFTLSQVQHASEMVRYCVLKELPDGADTDDWLGLP